MTATFSASLELLTSATFAWAAYFVASFAGVEFLQIVAGVPAFFLSAVGFAGLAIAGALWVAKHIRITVV